MRPSARGRSLRLNPITSRALWLSLGVGLYELARASLFVYSFRFEPSHLAELLCYPLLLAGLPLALSALLFRGGRLSDLSALTWLMTASCALIPFLYERSLTLPPPARLGLTLSASLALASTLLWARRSAHLSDPRLELSCAALYCLSVDSGLELSKALLNALTGRGLSLKVFIAWGALYLALLTWLALHQRWSAHPKRLTSLILLSGLAHTALYTDPRPSPQPARSLKTIDTPSADIYLVIFDAMRGDARDFVRSVEGEGAHLKALESLSARSLDFRDAHSASLATYESIPRLLELKGSQPFLRFWPLKNRQRWEESLPGRLGQLGYETHLLTDYPNAVLKGFDAVDWTGVSSLRGRHFRLLNLPGDLLATLTGARALLKARRGATLASATEPPLLAQLSDLLSQPKTRPRFVVLHLSTPHQPYAFPPYQAPELPATFEPERANEEFLSAFSDATPEQIKRFKQHYAHALHGADHTLSQLLELLERHGDPRRDLLVVTADHGELFGDHGLSRLAHGGHLYQASHHVPLLISGMGLTPQRIEEPVSQMRLAPTLYELLKVEPTSYAQGSLLRRSSPQEASFELRYAQRGGVAQRGKWRLIWSAHPKWLSREDWGHRVPLELYHLDSDPDERVNLVSDQPELVEELCTYFKLPLPQKD